MKGYSFDELVKLATAAVKRAGDTMTGNLTAPKVLVSDAQGTEVNALTRKDYVDGGLSKKLNLTGDGTIAGNLTIATSAPILCLNEVDTTKKWFLVADGYGARFQPDSTGSEDSWRSGPDGTFTCKNPHSQSPQGSNAGSLTRKDYVDSTIAAGDARQVSKYGDTMTGNLTISNFAPIFTLNETDTGKNWLLVAEENSCRFQMNNTDGRKAWEVNSAGTVSIYDPISTAAQGGAAGSLTRKDYVDGQVAARAPMAHTHTVADITDLRTQDVWTGANTLAVRDENSDIYARLLRATFPDQSNMFGAIAFRANNSNDNYTRYCSNPAAVRDWMRTVKTSWDMSWRAYIEDPTYPMTEYHIPGKAAVITYLASDGVYRIDSSNGAGGSTGDRLAIDAGGNLYAKRGVHDTGVRVYSPNNPPPLVSHNHSAAQSNADIVAGGWDHIGAYVMAQVYPADGIGVIPPGNRLPGASLRPCSMDTDYDDMYGATLPGAWQCQGYARGIAANERDWNSHKTLWIRVA